MLAAHEAGRFAAELAPMTIKTKKGETEFSFDEHPRPKTTIEGLAKLKPVFKKDGTVTAGNASVSFHMFFCGCLFCFFVI